MVDDTQKSILRGNRVLPGGRSAWVDDTVWTVDVEVDGRSSIQWMLRYGPQHLDRRDHMVAAAILGEFAHLTDPRLPMKDAIAGLRLARKAAALCLEAADV